MLAIDFFADLWYNKVRKTQGGEYIMLKLTVSDFDGTLRRYEDEELRPAVLKKIQALLEGGMTFAVSSGRTHGELVSFFGELSDRLWLLCCDGAYAVKEGRVYYGKPISRENLALFDRAQAPDFSYVLHGAFANYSCGTLPPDTPWGTAMPIASSAEITDPIYKVTTYGATVRLPAYCALRMHWDGGKNNMAQYVNRFANKGVALSDLQTRLMLTKFDTACIGDSGNDIAMMHNAKLTVCVGTRSIELAALCKQNPATAEEALDLLL